MEKFKNREEAGRLLAEKLKAYKNQDALVIAIPRGGVPLGYEIAKTLHLPLDIIVSKKIGHPSNPEYAIGAVSRDSVILNPDVNVSDIYIEREIERLQKLTVEKYNYYRNGKNPIPINKKTVILVDDGIATGKTLLASIDMLRKQNPKQIIVAAPVVPRDTITEIEEKADKFIYLMSPLYFGAVGNFYEDFSQTEDDEVIYLLNKTDPDNNN